MPKVSTTLKPKQANFRHFVTSVREYCLEARLLVMGHPRIALGARQGRASRIRSTCSPFASSHSRPWTSGAFQQLSKSPVLQSSACCCLLVGTATPSPVSCYMGRFRSVF